MIFHHEVIVTEWKIGVRRRKGILFGSGLKFKVKFVKCLENLTRKVKAESVSLAFWALQLLLVR